MISSSELRKLAKESGERVYWDERIFEKAVTILRKGEEKGVFVWAPRLRYWLKDPDYIFWLGTARQ